MYKFFNDFDSIFELGFGKPLELRWESHGIKDMNPAVWEKTEEGFKARIKTLGITEVKIEILDDGVRVHGENELDGNKYNVSMILPIVQDVMDNVIEIKHETIAGITFVNLVVDRPAKRSIKINGK